MEEILPMNIDAAFCLLLMSLSTQGDSILSAHRHYPLGPNVRMPVPLLTATAQLLVERRENYLMMAGKVDQRDLDRASPLIVNELKIYSEAMLSKSQVKQIIFSNKVHAGTSSTFRLWGGLAYYQHHSLLLDASLPSHYLPQAFHHEFFHFLDMQMYYSGYDPEWAGLNEPQFRYIGMNAKFLYHSRDKNFITDYSLADMAEDKAEIYAYLITKPQYVEDCAKQSPVLQRKIDCLKRRLKAFSSEFDNNFWISAKARAISASIPQSYRLPAVEIKTEELLHVWREATDRTESTDTYKAPYFIHPPPMSDGMKIVGFVLVMLMPWYIVAVVSALLTRLRANKSRAVMVDTPR